MKEKPRSFLEEATEEMIEWRGMSQEERINAGKTWRVDNRGRGSGYVQGGGQQKMSTLMQTLLFGMEARGEKREVRNTKVGRRLSGKNFRLVQRIQLAATAKHA